MANVSPLWQLISHFADAEAAFMKVLQLAPTHLKAEENLGLVYDAENKPEKAEEALRTATRWADERKLRDSWPYLYLQPFT